MRSPRPVRLAARPRGGTRVVCVQTAATGAGQKASIIPPYNVLITGSSKGGWAWRQKVLAGHGRLAGAVNVHAWVTSTLSLRCHIMRHASCRLPQVWARRWRRGF